MPGGPPPDDRHVDLGASRVAVAQVLGEPGARHPVADDEHASWCHRTPSSRTAHALNSGIRLVGSSAGLVSRFALPEPPQ